jgi:hypothetical protein
MPDEPYNNQPETDIPDPEYLIKSIAEQGYRLETSLADLIDNAITADADKIEILADTNNEPFELFLADNGNGMDEKTLIANMKFPSASPDHIRQTGDLGRFGLGMKTASFAQTRLLTVLTRKKGTIAFHARTWDINFLKEVKKWIVIRNTTEETDQLLTKYRELSKGFLNEFPDYIPNTIIVWRGLYKFEDYIENNKEKVLQKEITEITAEYLSLVFHRFMEKKERPVRIRINNEIICPFDPFPNEQIDFRRLESSHRQFRSDYLKIEGFVLPSRSLDENKRGNSIWTPNSKSLMDMEGLYIYRSGRIISYGGWNNIIKKSPRLQLARLRVEIGNSVDHLFHLNVAKSSIVIPYELRVAFLRYVSELKDEAEKEYYNRSIKTISAKQAGSNESVFLRRPQSKGMLLELNENFPVIALLKEQLTEQQFKLFRIIARLVNTSINKTRQVHEDASFAQIIRDPVEIAQIKASITALKRSGLTNDLIRQSFLIALGFRIDTVPTDILELLK